MIIKLTDNEWEIIEHRLSLSDSVADVLSDQFDGLTYEQAQDKCEALCSRIEASKTIDVAALTEHERAMLVDCMDGSTFFADIDDAVWEGEMTRGKVLALRKAGRSLQRKLNEAGIEGEMCWD